MEHPDVCPESINNSCRPHDTPDVDAIQFEVAGVAIIHGVRLPNLNPPPPPPPPGGASHTRSPSELPPLHCHAKGHLLCMLQRDADDVHYIFNNAELFLKTDILDVVSDWLGDGLATQRDINKHAQVRRLLNPAFRTEYVKGLSPAFAKVGDQLADAVLQQGEHDMQVRAMTLRAGPPSGRCIRHPTPVPPGPRPCQTLPLPTPPLLSSPFPHSPLLALRRLASSPLAPEWMATGRDTGREGTARRQKEGI